MTTEGEAVRQPPATEVCTKWCERVVYCAVCHNRKSPRGRSAPMEMRCCEDDCPGYWKEPTAGHLWPGELADMDAEVHLEHQEKRKDAP